MEFTKKQRKDFIDNFATDLFDEMITNIPEQKKEEKKEEIKVVIKGKELEDFKRLKKIKRY